MKSLQGRLSAALLVSLFTVFLLQLVVVSIAIHRVTENYVAARLDHENENLLVALSFDGRDQPVLDLQRINPIYQRPFSGHYYRVSAGDTVLRSRSLWDQDMDTGSVAPGDNRTLHLTGPEGQHLLVLVQGYRKHGVALTLASAEDLTQVSHDILRFQIGYGVLTVVLLVTLVLVQRLMARRALRPLDQARHNVASLEHGEVQQLDEDVPLEIQPLVREINHLLKLTVQRLQRSRSSTGNLAHALKTPLTVLSQLADDPSLDTHPDIRACILRQSEAMRRLTDREMRRARLAGEGFSGSNFVPETEIPPLTAALRRIYSDKNLDIQTELAAGQVFAGDREDLLELVGNLLDNACKWARSRVRLTVRAEAGLHFDIEDDGPGVPADARARLMQRGTRLDEATEGYGLGLAIARDIVEQYDGTLELEDSKDLGGLRVTVKLPPPAKV